MKVLWAKDQFRENTELKPRVSRHSILQMLSGNVDLKISGDVNVIPEEVKCEGQTCQLCGNGEGPQKQLEDTCTELGETYQHVLSCVFGVKVTSSGGLICMNCTNLLLQTLNFKAMVLSVFEKPISEASSNNLLQSETKSPSPTLCRGSYSIIPNHLKRQSTRGVTKVTAVKKKAIVPCVNCGQKYPMLRSEDSPEFMCSRCKIRKLSDKTVMCAKCKTRVSSKLLSNHMEIHANSDLKGRCRLRSVPKKPSQTKNDEAKVRLRFPQKYCCTRCPKKYSQTRKLSDHMKLVHGVGNICQICKKDLRFPDSLERHMRVHENNILLECALCHRIFRNAQAYQKHILIHQTL